MKNFTLMDEGNYWETGDKKNLAKQFSKYEAVMDIFCESLNGMSQISGRNCRISRRKIRKDFKRKICWRKSQELNYLFF